MSSSHRAPRGTSSGAATRRSQRVTPKKVADQNQPQRGPSGFLDGLKSIVAGPLSWFGAVEKEDDSDAENGDVDGLQTGSKRRGGGGGGGGRKSPVSGHTRKRIRRESPPPAQKGPRTASGYLDPPPEVLRDTNNLANGYENRWDDRAVPPLAHATPVKNAIKTGITAHNSSEQRPHRLPSQVSPFQPPQYQTSTTVNGSVNRSPIRKPLPFLNTSAVPLPSSTFRAAGESTSPISRRNSSVMNLDLGPTHGAASVQSVNHAPIPRTLSMPGKRIFSNGSSDYSMRSPIDAEYSGISRSPSIVDRAMGSPERDHSQGPLRMGSLLRHTVKPAEPGHGQYSTQAPHGLFGALDGHNAPLSRRSTSLMTIDPLTPGSPRREPSRLIFEPTLGITTVGEAAAAAARTASPSPRPPRNNAERILQALEQATPLTEARKLRQKQKEAIKVPAASGPGPFGSLGSRTSRMVNPYGRPVQADKAPSEGAASGPTFDKGVGRAPGALRRYLDAGRKAREEHVKTQVKESTKLAPVQEDIAQEDAIVEEPKEDKKVDQITVIEKQDKGVETIAPEESAPSRSIQMPGRATSSLRAARAPTYRSHVPSSRPTKRATNRFSANFADDDDDGMEEDQGGLRADELEQWAKSTGTGLVVPTGWSFKTVDAAKPTDAEAVAAEPSKSAADEEKRRRDELVEKLVGGKPVRTNPFASAGPPILPKVPSGPFQSAARPGVPPSLRSPEPSLASASSVPQVNQHGSSLVPVSVAASSFPAAPKPVGAPGGFSFGSLPAPQPKPETELAPKTKNGPQAALPFTFGPSSSAPKAAFNPFAAPSIAAPTPALAPTVQAAVPAAKSPDPVVEGVPKPTPQLAAHDVARPSLGSGFSFGVQPATKESEMAPQSAIEPPRSMAPSPSPFLGLGKGHPSAPPVDSPKRLSPPEATAAEQTKAPSPFSFAPQSKTLSPPDATPAEQTKVPSPFSFAPPPMSGNVAPPPIFGGFGSAPSSTPGSGSVTSQPAEHKPPSLFGATPSLFAPAPSAEPQPTPAATVQSSSTPSSNPFSFSVPVATPATGSTGFQIQPVAAATQVTTSAPPTPSFSFSGSSTLNPQASPFSPFPTSAAADDEKPKFTFNFGAPANANTSGSVAGSRPATPPRVESDSMMDEGSPSRETQAANNAPAKSQFSFTGISSPFTSTPPATATAPAFSFGSSNPPNIFTNQNSFSTNGNGSTTPFGQPTPASPFTSNPASPFQSPVQQLQAINSPAASVGAFGSPQQTPGAFATGFSFSSNPAGGVTSPTQTNAVTSPTSTGPAFVFSSGVSNSSPDRPIKPLGARRTGSTAARRGMSGRR